MIFRVVGIKEVSKRNYNLDVLIEADSADFIRNMLHDLWVVVLDVAEYPWDALSFWTAWIVLKYNDQDVNIVSNLTNLRMVAHKFILMWFEIKSINFLDEWHKMSDQVASKLLQTAINDVELEKKVEKEDWQSEEKKEEVTYRDEDLEKTWAVAKWQIDDINEKIYAIWTKVSSKDLKDIRTMEQELWKLRMGRNIDKIIDLLEKVIVKALDIKQRYLISQKANEVPIFKWSWISDVDVMYELNILDKAKNIAKIWKSRTFDDQYYWTFWFAWVELKFLWKDIVRKFTDLTTLVFGSFEFIGYVVLFVLIVCSLVLWLKWLWKWAELNSYLYVILIMFGIGGGIWYALSFVRNKDILVRIILMALRWISSVVLFLLIKYFFVI